MSGYPLNPDLTIEENAKVAARHYSQKWLLQDYTPAGLFTYMDEIGKPLGWVYRLNPPPNSGKRKEFGRMKLDSRAGEILPQSPMLPSGKTPLFNLDKLAVNPGAPVYFVEGEGKVLELEKFGILATTNIGGADSMSSADLSSVQGRTVTHWQDNDASGARHRVAVTKAAQALGCSVKWIEIPPLNLPLKGDVVDWLLEQKKANPKAAREEIAAAVAALSRVDPMNMEGVTDKSDEWAEPQSLERHSGNQFPYPVNSLPELIRDAVKEYQRYGQQPFPIIAASALGCVSVSVQGLADVARDEKLRGPLSLFFLTIAKSGERKTAADTVMSKVIREWERERADTMKPEIKRSLADHDAWEAARNGILAEIKKAQAQNSELDGEKLRSDLQRHELEKPELLIAPRLIYENVTPEALAADLEGGYPSAALWSDEGGIVTGSHGMGKDSILGFMTAINRLWDGGDIEHRRKEKRSVSVQGRRLTVNLMIQPNLFVELLERGSGMARGSGFLARYLIAAPASAQGSRPYRPPPAGSPCLARFHTRVRELLNSPLPLDEHGRLSPPLLRLSPEAFERWRAFHDEVEKELSQSGQYPNVSDFASKSADQAVRMAGCFQVFAGAQGAVGVADMERGVALARWYLCEALRTFETFEEPQEWEDARLLDGWLEKQGGTVKLGDILRLGPPALRDRQRRDDAVALLNDLGRARRITIGRRELIERNPAIQEPATAKAANFANVSKEGARVAVELSQHSQDSQSQPAASATGESTDGNISGVPAQGQAPGGEESDLDEKIYGAGKWMKATR